MSIIHLPKKGERVAVDWTKLFEAYTGEWVALKNDEKSVIVHGKNPKEVLQKAIDKGFDKPILLKVPKKVSTYIG